MEGICHYVFTITHLGLHFTEKSVANRFFKVRGRRRGCEDSVCHLLPPRLKPKSPPLSIGDTHTSTLAAGDPSTGALNLWERLC